MFETLYTQIGAVLVVAVLGFALWKGEEPERGFAGLYLVAWLATMLVQNRTDLFHLQYGMLAIDLVFLVFLIGLTWKTDRTWPSWALAFQLLILAGILIPWFDPRLPAWSHLAVLNLATLGLLGSLAVGTFWVWQERRAAGLE
ncbi:MAG: hypothetical protein ACI8U3_000268 [Brevundimonas sp.]|jgi:hypothetical protein|uniref:hypothetical protein n=1 Tax=Brevundimonas sp. TaxID=1871086 RepID=UPI0039E56091